MKTIPGYKGRYAVTVDGKIYSYKYKRYLKIWNRHGRGPSPRPSVRLHDGKGKPKTYFVHRIVALVYIPNPENKSEVNHIDGNPLNSHHTNLEWNTRSENQKHAWDNGLTTKFKKMAVD